MTTTDEWDDSKEPRWRLWRIEGDHEVRTEVVVEYEGGFSFNVSSYDESGVPKFKHELAAAYSLDEDTP